MLYYIEYMDQFDEYLDRTPEYSKSDLDLLYKTCECLKVRGVTRDNIRPSKIIKYCTAQGFRPPNYMVKFIVTNYRYTPFRKMILHFRKSLDEYKQIERNGVPFVSDELKVFMKELTTDLLHYERENLILYLKQLNISED